MDNKLELLLNSRKNIDSVNIDYYQKLELLNNTSDITEYNIRNVISATRVFEIERENTEIYRIYGEIEYLSLFNGLSFDYTNIIDFLSPFNVIRENGRNILNSFDFYLVKPIDFINIIGNTYERLFEIITTPENIDIFPVGYSKNIFFEQKYAFNIKTDIDISNYRDTFGFPPDNLFLFTVFKPIENGLFNMESMERINFSGGGYSTLNYNTYSVGDIINGDLIKYDVNDFKQTTLSAQTYYINTEIEDYLNDIVEIQWKYNPFIPLRMRYFSDNVEKVNSGTTMYEQEQSIPEYATYIGNGNYVWRNILPQGFIDPLTGIGVDYPFVNKRRYLFSNTIISVTPNMDDVETKFVFENIEFDDPLLTNKTPNSDLNNIGKPCQ